MLSGVDPIQRGSSVDAIVSYERLQRITGAPTDARSLDDAVAEETMPAGPPPEVVAAIAAADAAYQNLQVAGLQVAFSTGDAGRIQAELQKLDGTPISGLTPDEVLGLTEPHGTP